MKIEMNKIVFSRQESFNLNFDDDLKGLFTPTITNVCHEFLKSLPTPQIAPQLDASELFLDLNTPQLKMLNKTYSTEVNPFLTSLSAEVKLNQQQPQQQITFEQIIIENDCVTIEPIIQNQISVDTITLDHDYTISPKKRKNSFVEEESNSVFNFEATNSSVATPNVSFKQFPTTTATTTKRTRTSESSEKGSKRKRVKGIYRANDVTNTDELNNYLERRRKNNISSKQSRLTKKNVYSSMDEKSNQLEKDNEGLKQTITNLESLTKLLKDVLLQRFTSTIK
jgi:hypothetical protein